MVIKVKKQLQERLVGSCVGMSVSCSLMKSITQNPFTKSRTLCSISLRYESDLTGKLFAWGQCLECFGGGLSPGWRIKPGSDYLR